MIDRARRNWRRLKRTVGGIEELVAGQRELLEGQARLAEDQARLVEGQERLVEGQARLAEGQAQVLESQQQVLLRQWQMIERQVEIQTRIRRTQALTARAYEAIHDWPAQLAAARAAPEYELAYEDPDPLISIAISTYHSPVTLCERTLPSVLAQSHTNWEAIVVGDHCTDDTEERVLALGDTRIRFHNLPVRENEPGDPWERWAVKGSVPRSVGIGMARGRWIAPLSHDDAWDPDHLETLLRAVQSERAEVAYSKMRLVNDPRPDEPPVEVSESSIGVWPPRLGGFAWQSAIFHGSLGFFGYDRACALASEPNDWNLARRAWEAGVRFTFVDRETSSLHVRDSFAQIRAEYEALGLPPTAVAYP